MAAAPFSPASAALPDRMLFSNALIWLTGVTVLVSSQPTQGIVNLVKRRLASHVDDFEFHLLGKESTNSNDAYNVSSLGGKILVEGNSLSALLGG